MLETKRYLGLELAGAKNQKSSLAAIQYYPREGKTFLLDIFDRITHHDDQTGDEALLELIHEENASHDAVLGVNVSLELPPCIVCEKKVCPQFTHCNVPAMKWAREWTQKIAKKTGKSIKLKEYTPYTQRPVELWIRYHILPQLPPSHHFEIDETLGGNRAPLTARMHYLKRHLQKIPLLEAWPKLTVAILAAQLDVPRRIISSYRQLEDGAYSREIILNHLVGRFGLFVYERDMRKLSQSLTAFDAFICALTALLSDQGLCDRIPKSFPESSGWVHYPNLSLKKAESKTT